MNKTRLVTIGVRNYYRFPINDDGDFDSFEVDNLNQKIDFHQKDKIKYPERYYLPLPDKRTSEVFEVIENPAQSKDNKISLKYDGEIAQSSKALPCAIAMSEDEVIFTQGNIVSISVDEDSHKTIMITLVNECEYFLTSEESIRLLNRYPRETFQDAKNLLRIYDLTPDKS